MLKVEHVTKCYGKLKAVNDLSFTVQEGEIFGLLGLNGAGKTTTFRMIMGLIDDYDGDIYFDGEKIGYKFSNRIGFLTEERSLLTKMTVFEQIKFYATLKDMEEEKIEKELDKLLKEFGISEYKNRKIKELSKGNQQKIQFISAIIHHPSLLILDEPFSGLDPLNVELFKKKILELKNNGTMIIFSSHRMEHVEMFCEKLVVLVKGKSVIEGYLKDIKNEFRKKKVIVCGDINIKEVEKLDGVINVDSELDNYIISIKDIKYVNSIFKAISKYPNITKYMVQDASLNDIFLEKVGEAYEE